MIQLGRVFNKKVFDFGVSVPFAFAAGMFASIYRSTDTRLFPGLNGEMMISSKDLIAALVVAAGVGISTWRKPITTPAVVALGLGTSFVIGFPQPKHVSADTFADGKIERGTVNQKDWKDSNSCPREGFIFGRDNLLTTTSSKPAPIMAPLPRQPV